MEEKKMDLGQDKITSLFWKYAIPSVSTMLIMSIYFVVDGIFISRGVGSEALAAVNLCVPVTLIANAVTLSIAIGASIIISIFLSRREYKRSNNVFSILILTNVSIAVIFTIAGLFFSEDISFMLGANEEVLTLTQTYLSVILYFLIFFTLQCTLSTVVRNDKNPNLALVGSIFGSVINIPLDALFIFVFRMGVFGAAFATGLSQVTGLLILLTHFVFKKGDLRFQIPSIEFDILRRIFSNSAPIFISLIAAGTFMTIMNISASKYYGTSGISAYAVVGGISMFLMMVVVGISQTIQPLVSYNHGIGNKKRVKQIVYYAFFVGLIVCLVIMVGIFIFAEKLVGIYINPIAEHTLAQLTIQALRIYSLSFIFAPISLIYISYLQSIEDNKSAMIINFLRSLVVPVTIAYILPQVFGGIGIWLLIPCTELSIVSILFLLHLRKII